MSAGSIEDLQERLTHQEVAIETLSETLVRQDRLIAQLQRELTEVRRLLHELRPSPLGGHAADEPPPPHY